MGKTSKQCYNKKSHSVKDTIIPCWNRKKDFIYVKIKKPTWWEM